MVLIRAVFCIPLKVGYIYSSNSLRVDKNIVNNLPTAGMNTPIKLFKTII